MPGLADHDTIKQVVRIGFSPLETIRMATLDGATFLGIQDRTGSIAVGEEADLQVVRGAPDQNIRDMTTSRSSSRTESRTTPSSCYLGSKAW
jgi:imidazolonepropionase-like amidohydrolase